MNFLLPVLYKQLVFPCLRPQLESLHILDGGLADEDALYLENQSRLLLTVLHLLVQVHSDVIGSGRVLQDEVCVPLRLQLVLGQQLVVNLQGISEPSDATGEPIDLVVSNELRRCKRLLDPCVGTVTHQSDDRLDVGFFRV